MCLDNSLRGEKKLRKNLILFLILIAAIASATLQLNFPAVVHGAPTTNPNASKIGKLVIPQWDCWIRVGETIPLNTQAFDEFDQRIPTPTLKYVISRPAKTALGGNRPELVSINSTEHTVTGLFEGVTGIRAIDPNVTERGQVNSNELTIVVLPMASHAQSTDILVAGYIKVNGSYFGDDAEITLTSPSGTVERLTAGANGYFHFGWGHHFGKVLKATLAGFSFEPQVVDGREYYILDGKPSSTSSESTSPPEKPQPPPA